MKLNKILTAMLFLATLVGCGGVGTSSQPNSQSNSNEVGSSINSQGSTTEFSSATSEVNKVENKVKIKSIDVVDEEQKIKNARRMSSGNESSEETSNDIITSSEEIVSSSSENSETSSEETPSIDDINMNKNWVLIYKSQTDITFTVTLDDPRHLGIDALIITCDDPESQIKVGDTYKPIQMEADGTRMVDWGDDPYEQTYHIRTTSPDAVNSFKVLDVRITNHEKFQSEETDNRDLGNNELKIYKMDDDAIKLNVVENTFEYVKFNYVIKEGYEELISNVVVEGMTPDEDGYYVVRDTWGAVLNVEYEYYLSDLSKYFILKIEDEVRLIRASFIFTDSNFYDMDALYCGTNKDGEIIFWIRLIIDGSDVYNHVKLYYKGVEIIPIYEEVGLNGGIISNADFGMTPGSDEYPDIGDKLPYFMVVVGDKSYELEFTKKNNGKYMIYGLKEIVEE